MPHLDRHVQNLPRVQLGRGLLAVRELAPLAQILVALVEAALLDEILRALIAQLAAAEKANANGSDEHGWVVAVGGLCSSEWEWHGKWATGVGNGEEWQKYVENWILESCGKWETGGKWTTGQRTGERGVFDCNGALVYELTVGSVNRGVFSCTGAQCVKHAKHGERKPARVWSYRCTMWKQKGRRAGQ